MGPTDYLLLLAGALTVLYFWLRHQYTFWQRTNVPHIKATSIFGNLKETVIMQTSAADRMVDLYQHKNAQNQPFVGIYMANKPAVLLRDPELMKTILIKDFNKFSDRYSSCDPHGDPLGNNNLFFAKNPFWKEMRTKLTPVFTSGKIKQMFPLVREIGNELDEYLCNMPVDPTTNSCIKELKSISALYTTDVIASVAYGVKANAIQNPDCDFRQSGRSVLNFTTYRGFSFICLFFMPRLGKLLKCKLFPKEATKFIRETINYVIDERIKNGNTRNDLIDILAAFKTAGQSEKDKGQFSFSNDMLVAQAAFFLIAGFETSSATISFTMYELSKKPELQKRLRQEIKEALMKNNGQITYEMIQEMEYLNMVVQEALRMYPALPFLDRLCTLAKGETEYPLKPYSEFGIPHGMPVIVPMFAIQRDPKYFTNPNEFNPERFNPENKPKIVSGSYMPFGVGPHNCIAERFGLLQTKLGVMSFLRNHFVTSCEKSHKEMLLEPKALILQPKDGIYCKLVRDKLID